MSQNSKFVFPIRSSLVKEPEAYRPRRGVSVSGEAGTYPALSSLSTTFFASRKFFSGRQERLSLRRRSGNLTALPSVVNIFFSKNLPCLAPPCGVARPARRSVPQRRERVMHLSALPVNDFLELFSFFSHVTAFLLFFRRITTVRGKTPPFCALKKAVRGFVTLLVR